MLHDAPKYSEYYMSFDKYISALEMLVSEVKDEIKLGSDPDRLSQIRTKYVEQIIAVRYFTISNSVIISFHDTTFRRWYLYGETSNLDKNKSLILQMVNEIEFILQSLSELD